MVTMRAGLLVEGDECFNPKADRWFEVVRTAAADDGHKVRVLLRGLKPMVWDADTEISVRRGETGRAIDAAGLGQEGGIVSGE